MIAKRRLLIILSTGLLLASSLSPLIGLAVTTDSSEQQTSAIRNNESTSNSSSANESSLSTTNEEESEPAEPEQVTVEEKYEERNLLNKKTGNSIHPVLVTKQEVNGVTFKLKGTVEAPKDEKVNVHSKTILKKIVLQSKKENEEWLDEKEFDVGDEYELSAENYSFDFEREISSDVDTQWRLVLDYSIDEYQNDSLTKQTHHKGQYLVESSENSSTTEISGTRENDSESNETESTSENNHAVLAPAYSDLPRIGPRAYAPEVKYGNDSTYSQVFLTDIRNRSLKIFLKWFLGNSATWGTELTPHGRVIISNDPNFIKNKRTNPESDTLSNTEWSAIKTASQQSDGNTTISSITLNSSATGNTVYTFAPVELNGMKPHKEYYMWIYALKSNAQGEYARAVSPTFQNLPSYKKGDSSNKYVADPYVFTTRYDPVTDVSTPKVESVEFGPTVIKMRDGTYKGDPWQDGNRGKVSFLKVSANTWETKTETLVHDKTFGGKYGIPNNTITYSDLQVGTKYKVQVQIPDAKGDYLPSGTSKMSDEVATTVTLNNDGSNRTVTPEASEADKAEAEIDVIYQANDAHPLEGTQNIQLELKKENENFNPVSINDKLAGAQSINKTTKRIKFKLQKLSAKTNYTIKYRVKNIGHWSHWREVSFKTAGVKLKNIPKPSVNNITSISARIYNPSGSVNSYSGDPKDGAQAQMYLRSTASNNYTPQNDSSWEEKATSSLHFGNKQYNAGIVGSTEQNQQSPLIAGKKYDVCVGVKNTKDVMVYSEKTPFVTANEVLQPNEPTLTQPTSYDNASAVFKAGYKADNAHPIASKEKIKVMISSTTDTQSEYSEVPNEKIDGTPSVDTSNKLVGFKIIGLKSNQKYWIKYKVMNDSGVFSNLSPSRSFKTSGVNLDKISPPKFTHDDPEISDKSTSIKMKSGTYEGDTMDDNNGIVQIRSNSERERLTTNLGHDAEYRTYDSFKLQNLKPGTQYEAQVVLFDTIQNQSDRGRYSEWRTFYTANKAEKPEVETVNGRSQTSGVVATISGNYKAGEGNRIGAHPLETDGDGIQGTGVKIEIKEGNGPWENINTTTEPKTTKPTIDTAIKKVEFGVSELRLNTNYKIRFKVQNASKQWSDFSEEEILSTPAPLNVLAPCYYQVDAGINKIYVRQARYIDGAYYRDPESYGKFLLRTNGQGEGEVIADNRTIQDMAGPTSADIHGFGLGYPSSVTPEASVPLKEGSKYEGRWSVRNSNNSGDVKSDWSTFFTSNKLAPGILPTIETYLPTNSTAEFDWPYMAGGTYGSESEETAEAAHPNEVKIEITDDVAEGTSWDEIPGTSWQVVTPNSNGPKLSNEFGNGTGYEIDQSTKKIRFKIEGLEEGESYYLRVRTKNGHPTEYVPPIPPGGQDNSAGKSGFVNLNESGYSKFQIVQRSSGYYINNAPNFDFGTLNIADLPVTDKSLDSSNGSNDFVMDIENIGVDEKWSLSAKFSELVNADPERSDILTGAYLTMDKKLEKVAANGTIESDVTASFNPVSSTSVTLTAGDSASIPIWEAPSITEGQSWFKHTIDFDSVKLTIPSNNVGRRGDSYEGKITWTMDNLPEPEP